MFLLLWQWVQLKMDGYKQKRKCLTERKVPDMEDNLSNRATCKNPNQEPGLIKAASPPFNNDA